MVLENIGVLTTSFSMLSNLLSFDALILLPRFLNQMAYYDV